MSDKLKIAAREYFQRTLAVAERDRQGIRLMGSQLEIRLRSLTEATQYAEDSIRRFKQDGRLPLDFDKIAEEEGKKIGIDADEVPIFYEYLLCAEHQKWLIMHDRYAGRDDPKPHYVFLFDETSDVATSRSPPRRIRGRGRPSPNWKAMEKELYRRKAEDDLPPVGPGWKTEVSGILADWHAQNCPDWTPARPKTKSVRDKLQPILDEVLKAIGG